MEDLDSDEDNSSFSEIENISQFSKSQVSVEDSNSHTSLCNGLKVLKMKGLVGRPRKRSKKFRNPFDFGCSLKKNLKKKSTLKNRTIMQVKNSPLVSLHLDSINEDAEDSPKIAANEILHLAKNLDMETVVGKDFAVSEIANQIVEGKL